jgi:hypothetical protein
MSTGNPRFAVLLLIVFSVSYSPAQVSTAELSGTVTDPTGAVIGQAKITATNADTGVSREASSDSAGNYIMTLLPPDNYNISVEAQGFRRVRENGVALEVNQRAKVDFTLEVGQVNETPKDC